MLIGNSILMFRQKKHEITEETPVCLEFYEGNIQKNRWKRWQIYQHISMIMI